MTEPRHETRRDRRRERGGGRSGLLIAAAAVAVLATGGAAFAAFGGGGHDDTASATSAASVPSDGASSEGPSPLVAQCRSESAAAAQLASTLKGVADDWRTHTTALTDYEDGKISLDKAKSNWASSKMAGPGHLKSYDAALEDYDAAKGSCAKAADGGDLQPAVAQSCTDRATAATTLAKDGKSVADEWQKHVNNMKHKQHTDAIKYDRTWRAQVKAAPPKLAAYDKAAAAFGKTKPCAA